MRSVMTESTDRGHPPVEARDLQKSYVGGDGSGIDVLRGVDFTLERGGAVAITGASGS
jgi:ABC-type lipoprotein export system ATPase subunit